MSGLHADPNTDGIGRLDIWSRDELNPIHINLDMLVLIGTRTKKVLKKPSLFAQYDLDCRGRLSALAKEVAEARARCTRETPQSASMVPW